MHYAKSPHSITPGSNILLYQSAMCSGPFILIWQYKVSKKLPGIWGQISHTYFELQVGAYTL